MAQAASVEQSENGVKAENNVENMSDSIDDTDAKKKTNVENIVKQINDVCNQLRGTVDNLQAKMLHEVC